MLMDIPLAIMLRGYVTPSSHCHMGDHIWFSSDTLVEMVPTHCKSMWDAKDNASVRFVVLEVAEDPCWINERGYL